MPPAAGGEGERGDPLKRVSLSPLPPGPPNPSHPPKLFGDACACEGGLRVLSGSSRPYLRPRQLFIEKAGIAFPHPSSSPCPESRPDKTFKFLPTVLTAWALSANFRSDCPRPVRAGASRPNFCGRRMALPHHPSAKTRGHPSQHERAHAPMGFLRPSALRPRWQPQFLGRACSVLEMRTAAIAPPEASSAHAKGRRSVQASALLISSCVRRSYMTLQPSSVTRTWYSQRMPPQSGS